MKIKDSVFGELIYNYIWFRDMTIDFLGKEVKISLMVDGDEDGEFEEEQYEAYKSLIQKWGKLQQNLLQSILDYYKQERHTLGYDIELNEQYPLIETKEQLLEKINLEGITVSYAGSFEGRDTGILFGCTWNQENGVGLRLVNEEVVEVGYQDIAI